MDNNDNFLVNNPNGNILNLDGANDNHNLRRLLISWGVPSLHKTLHDNNVTVERLVYLQKHHLDKLFYHTPVGDQAQFEHFLSKWKKQNGQNFDSIEKCDEIEKPTTKHILGTISDSSTHGSKLKAYYEEHSAFNEQHRSALIQCISNYISANGLPYTLAYCSTIEKEIISYFPNEKLEFYTDGNRGRLYNKLSNMRRSVNEITPKTIKNKKLPNNADNLCSEKNALDTIKLMRSEEINADIFDSLWKQCAQYRLIKIKSSENTAAIFNDWPEYMKPYGFRFVTYDFEMKFPRALNFVTEWGLKSYKIRKFLQNKITNASVSSTFIALDDLSEDSRNFYLLWALHFAFPPLMSSATTTSGSKTHNKGTIADSQESFAIVGSSMQEVELHLKLLKMRGAPIQPRLLIVGEVSNVKEVLVYFDELRYSLLNVLHATDICFKLFYIFNLKYPDLCNNFYKFLGTYLFGMPHCSTPKIACTINEIDKC